ncbi:MAG: MlaD family protein [Prolixibacteraceae bacterium]|nr:MlaD family protein [Prolixibacteraceae bacterium]
MRISGYTKLGILIVISITILIWGLSYLQGVDILKRNNVYHVVYDRIDGLQESNEVVLSGYKIGQVKEIRFLPDNSGKLVVSLTTDAKIRIPVNSVAQIVSSDLMGTRSIKLILSDNKEYFQYGDTLPGAVERDLREQVSMQVLPIKTKAEELLGTLDSTLTVLTVIFNEDARKNLAESFENINQTIYNLEKTTSDLQEIVSNEKGNVQNIISNVNSIASSFHNSTSDLENIITNLSGLSDSLAQISISPLLDNIVRSSSQVSAILEKLEETDNTAGLLLNDDELYESLKNLTGSINLLTDDIRNNPERYVHFSAIDLGKNVYINASGQLAKDNIFFRIHLVSSKSRIPPESEYFEGFEDIEEYEVSGAYTYLAGQTNSYPEILELYEKVKKRFPEATIIAFRNGKLIKLERALKYLK